MMNPQTQANLPAREFGLRLAKIGQNGQKKTFEAVAIVGLGYVGLPLAVAAAKRGLKTIGYDIDNSKISKIRSGEANWIREEERLALPSLNNFESSSDPACLKNADVIVVCVPTPVHKNHLPDLSPLLKSARTIGENIKAGALVVIESTVNPGVCEEKALAEIEKRSGLKAEKDLFFAHCPERVNPGDDKYFLNKIPRVVGGSGPISVKKATEFYSSILEAEVVPMASIKEAEAVKMVENSFRDINIAFVNELAMAFDRAGIDLIRVIKAASTKPFGFLAHYPGCGVGGHCIPVDPYYLIRYGKANGFNHRFLKTARSINNEMPGYTVKLLKKSLREKGQTLKGKKVALLGLAYKRDIPDTRESPALKIRDLLFAAGAEVRTFDPLVKKESSVESLSEALKDATAAVIATDHTPFKELSFGDFKAAGVSIVIDGRNILNKETFAGSGITYKGIGH